MSSSLLDSHLDAIQNWIEAGYSNYEIVPLLLVQKGVSTTEASIRRCIDRNPSLKFAAHQRNVAREVAQHGEAPGVQRSESEIIITLPVDETAVSDLTHEQLLERHNLDPEEWLVSQTMVNQWEGNAGRDPATGLATKIVFYQFKVFFKKRVPLSVIAPAVEPLSRSFKPKIIQTEKPITTVIETDPQHPFAIPELNSLALSFIHWLQPDRWVCGGDLMNLGYVGRHRDNPKWDDTVNQAKQSAFDWLYWRRGACEDMEMWVIPGNHDDRIRNEQLERNERLYGITQAHFPEEDEGVPVYSLAHLLRFSELEINYREPEQTYEFEFVEISPLLAVRHGHKISNGGALKTANELGHSVVLGHTHSQSANAVTVWNKITNQYHTRWAIEAGCECEMEDGLGFNRAGAPDWQPGFVVVTSFPDGRFTFDFAHYTQDHRLYWRDKVFTL